MHMSQVRLSAVHQVPTHGSSYEIAEPEASSAPRVGRNKRLNGPDPDFGHIILKMFMFLKTKLDEAGRSPAGADQGTVVAVRRQAPRKGTTGQ